MTLELWIFGLAVDMEAWPELPMIFCAWDYHNVPIFRPQSQCDAEIPSIFAFQAAVHKQTPFNISRLQFVRHLISLLLNHYRRHNTSGRGVLCKLDIFVGWIPISNICSGNTKTPTVVSKILNFTFMWFWSEKTRHKFLCQTNCEKNIEKKVKIKILIFY